MDSLLERLTICITSEFSLPGSIYKVRGDVVMLITRKSTPNNESLYAFVSLTTGCLVTSFCPSIEEFDFSSPIKGEITLIND